MWLCQYVSTWNAVGQLLVYVKNKNMRNQLGYTQHSKSRRRKIKKQQNANGTRIAIS